MKNYLLKSVPVLIIGIFIALFASDVPWLVLLLCAVFILSLVVYHMLAAGMQLQNHQKFMTRFWLSVIVKMVGSMVAYGIYVMATNDKSLTAAILFFACYMYYTTMLLLSIRKKPESDQNSLP